jgi:Tol biopolymer transport system component
MDNLLAAEDGSIVITDTIDERRRMIALRPDGSDRRTITSGAGHAVDPAVIRGGNGLVFTLVGVDDAVPHVFRVDLDGGNLKQLTTAEGERALSVSPDGRTVLFRRNDRPNEVWSVPAAGGEPSVLLEESPAEPLISPDGRHVAYTRLREVEGRIRPFGVVALAGGGSAQEMRLPPRAGQPGWHPDSTAVTFVDTRDGVQNLWMARLAGGDPVPVTDFDEGQIRGYVWSDDGKRLLVCRMIGQAENLWLMDGYGGDARPITDFRSGFINRFVFLAGGERVVFVQGESRRDVVLIRDVGLEAGS